jgi:succinate dehydrogenase / fumarate reductase cytochrome b subunit
MLSLEFYSSSVGKKVIMAVTGVILIGYILLHLAGNLLIFLSPSALNDYSKFLNDLGPGLWAARIILLTAVGLHIWSAVQLAVENRKAKGPHYQFKRSIQTTYAARTMVFSGLIILAFIIYHLLHFTIRVTNPEISHLKDALGRHDVYSMVILSFQNVYVSAFYILAIFLLSLHLSHGFSSMFQSVGLNNEQSLPQLKWIGKVFSLLIFAGYASIPVCILLRVVK